MKMNALTVCWLVFLALIKIPDSTFARVRLVDLTLTATEGSCIKIKCELTNAVYDDNGAYWFWLKDAKWITNDYNGTVIYSTNHSECPVSPDFAGRVTYIGSSFSSWKNYYNPTPKPICSILICNLKKSDTGEYSFRFKKGTDKWSTNPNVTLTVNENPCPIRFEKPPAVKESESITLTCSTSTSCDSKLQIKDLSQLPSTQIPKLQKNNEATVSFTASWQDDGKEFSCQTQDNTDQYLVRNVSITVEYAPRDISAAKSSNNVKEGDSVTLTCLAKGVPTPNITWFKNEQEVFKQGEWKITSIDASYSGDYHCKAQNKHGTKKSESVSIDVTYAPCVILTKTSPTSELKEGDTMTLTCNVTRSNPQSHTLIWQKNGLSIVDAQMTTYVVNEVKPEDAGSYTCRANNSVGSRTSEPLQIIVNYRPRRTNIFISTSDVRIGQEFSFTCNTDASPSPVRYSWYRYNIKQFKPSQWTSTTTNTSILRLENVQRGDEANYKCNATNIIGTGDDSVPVKIKVLYPPTQLVLSMAEELTENMTSTISCTAESFPLSSFTLYRSSKSKSQTSEWSFTPPDNWPRNNTLQHRFNVTAAHAGFYTCRAVNSQGSSRSTERKLVVKYAPKDVTVHANPDFVVKENNSLTLTCSAKSYPEVKSITWMKTTDGKEKLIKTAPNLTVRPARPSDIGQYSCKAENEIGAGTSQKVQVNVKYAPKRTIIIRGAEKQEPDGKRSVMLSCSSDGYPPVNEYFWYRDKMTDAWLKRQNFTVYSDQPGDYFCVAKNEINKKASDPVTLFDRRFIFFLRISLCLILPLLILIIFFVYRHRRNKLIQGSTQGATPSCLGFLGWSNGVRRGTVLAEPFRSRDVLLPDQPYHPEAQRREPRPDNTPASNVTSVYCTVNVPHGKQAPTAQNPTRLQGGHTVDDSLNYASLSFGDKCNNKQVKPAEDTVYAKVCKSKALKKKEPEWLEDYENISAQMCAAKYPIPLDDSSDSSEDNVQLDYTQVSFTAKPGHQRARSDTSSDTSSDDEIHYSDVKI